MEFEYAYLLWLDGELLGVFKSVASARDFAVEDYNAPAGTWARAMVSNIGFFAITRNQLRGTVEVTA